MSDPHPPLWAVNDLFPDYPVDYPFRIALSTKKQVVFYEIRIKVTSFLLDIKDQWA